MLGKESKVNDHKRSNVLILKQILPNRTIKNIENREENLHIDTGKLATIYHHDSEE